MQSSHPPSELSRDALGTRLVVADASALRRAICLVREIAPIVEERNYLRGHPRYTYYRALHLYLACSGWRVELQVRTRRHDAIARWTHDTLLQPISPVLQHLAEHGPLITFMRRLADWCDACDTGLTAAKPTMPSELVGIVPGSLLREVE
jgi:hypothetical protein